jgi:hypothetical protein
MCGLIGFSRFVGGKTYIDKLNQLLYINSLTRGKDATGIYTTKSGVIKAAKDAPDFIKSSYKDFRSNLNDWYENTNVFIGHVRQKTTGEKIDENAHPFRFGNVVGAHNGVVRNYKELIKAGDAYEYKVDSMVIFARFAQDGNYKVLEEMDADAALIFHNIKEPDTLYVYRNNERPLFKGKIENSGLYFSSIPDSLLMIGCTDITEVKPFYVYKYTNGIYQGSTKVLSKVKPGCEYVTKADGIDFESLNIKIIDNPTGDTRFAGCTLYVLRRSLVRYHNSEKLQTSSYLWDCEGYDKDGGYHKSVEISQNNFDLNSYNPLFIKGSVVISKYDLFFSDDKNKKDKGKRKVATLQGELFKITEPLLDRSERIITIQSLENPNRRQVYLDAHNVEVISSNDELFRVFKEKNIPMPESLRILLNEEVENFDRATEQDLELVVDTVINKNFTTKYSNSHTTFKIHNAHNILDPAYDAELESEINEQNTNLDNAYDRLFKHIESETDLLRLIKSELPADHPLIDKITEQLSGSEDSLSIVSNLYEQYTITTDSE